ncbi:MAG TPA: T9SS type A sorting domain-containing protein, partial [Ignavibacteriaceae bacterium]|nr:T9SS type A sorting domain-containing protein [Ignavibacteriaceae bacterium]
IIGNYPNPFNPSTTISFMLPQREFIEINVYNSLGELINKLAYREFESGENKISWQGTDRNGEPVSSGIYFYKIKSTEKMLTGKMVLQK